jgi:hypothetical protein
VQGAGNVQALTAHVFVYFIGTVHFADSEIFGKVGAVQHGSRCQGYYSVHEASNLRDKPKLTL